MKINKTISPFYKEQSCVIAVSSSNEYAKYLCVYLMSLKSNADINQKYDIVILERDISEQDKKTIKNFIGTPYISVRFFNPSEYFKDYKLYVTHSYFKEECFFRLAAPVIFKNYKRIIFTDLDITLNDDILKLAKTDLKDNILAAAVEPLWRYLYDSNIKLLDHKIQEYTKDTLKLDNVYDYFNTGVCVFDVEKYNKENAFYHILENIQTHHYLYQEQCALNVHFKNRILKLSPIWNFEFDPTIIHNIPKLAYIKKYKEYEKDAKIYHFLGKNKPWKNAKEYKAFLWWRYARLTPFYEEILQKTINNKYLFLEQLPTLTNSKHLTTTPTTIEHKMKLLFVINHSWRFRLKLFWYAFQTSFSNGQKQKKYQEIKFLYQEAQKLKKKLLHI